MTLKEEREEHERHKAMMESDASKALIKLAEHTKQFSKMPFNEFNKQVE